MAEDIVVANGSSAAKVLEFDNIEVSRTLDIEEEAAPGTASSADHLPVLNGVEVVRQN